jgi:ABC-type nitrate/sulfonate/bicarbonate transport system substrate-binding protein
MLRVCVSVRIKAIKLLALMIKRKALCLMPLVILALWRDLSLGQSAKLENLRVSFASFGVIYYPHFVAKELGFYRDEGLDVEVIAMPGGLATQALVAGDLHFSTSSGSSLNASLRGFKLKVVYVNLDRPLYKLLSWRDDIRKVTDLRGKGIVQHRDFGLIVHRPTIERNQQRFFFSRQRDRFTLHRQMTFYR